MITTMTDISILTKANEFSEFIITSEIFNNYISSMKRIQEDTALQQQLKDFTILKEKYEEVQRFGKYHPDFKAVSSEVREAKRALDTHALIIIFKVNEKEIESLLDEISGLLASNVSPSIKVPSGSPFFTETTSCSGCGSGGSCGC